MYYKSSLEFVLRYNIAIILAFLCLCAYQLARKGSYRDPGSVFFDPSRAYERKYSDYRLEETKRTNITQQPAHDASTCIIFTTWKRSIEATIKSAVAGLSQIERADMHLAVLFAHSDPTAHPSWGIKVDNSISYKTLPEDQKSKMADLEEKGDVAHKGIEDYSLALDYCRSTKLPWIAVFEDDVIFADGWYAHLKQATLEPDTNFESPRTAPSDGHRTGSALRKKHLLRARRTRGAAGSRTDPESRAPRNHGDRARPHGAEGRGAKAQ